MKESFVLRTTSVSPLDRDKDTVLDPIKMLTHFSVFLGGERKWCRRRGSNPHAIAGARF